MFVKQQKTGALCGYLVLASPKLGGCMMPDDNTRGWSDPKKMKQNRHASPF